MKLTAAEVIAKFRLEPLPQEGGFFRRTYEHAVARPARELGIDAVDTRRLSTAIYFLVTPSDFSALHRVKSDELFHFYSGDSVEMIQIEASGGLSIITIGADLALGETPQVLVPAGIWQGLRLKEGGDWALLGTTVSPGFEYADFEIGDRAALQAEYPAHRMLIERFTR